MGNLAIADGAAAATSDIETAYRARTAGSAALAAEAQGVLPSGIVHDSRYIQPYGIYVTHAAGAHKWDVDGNRYIDYFGGHGALLLGHNPPEVMAAIADQLAKGTHFAACHEPEIRWAQKICALVPSAERVRFHASGTEATQMAVRLARAHTGRAKLMRFQGHYHGWQDDMTTGYASHFDGSAVIGVPAAVAAQTLAVDPYDEAEVERLLSTDRDIAAVIFEPLGAATGKVPLTPAFLEKLRRWTAENGVVLIFDEVITGFRVHPGGVQAAIGVTPDLTTMAKIVAGGLPGGAVAGKAAILEGLDFEASERRKREKIYHPGTFNACPVSAVAGITALDIIVRDDACAKASAAAQHLRERLNAVLDAMDVPWVVYGEASAFHIFMGDLVPDAGRDGFAPRELGRVGLHKQPKDAARLLRLALNIHGVDISGWPGGLLSAAHTEADLEDTATAFARSLEMLRQDGVI